MSLLKAHIQREQFVVMGNTFLLGEEITYNESSGVICKDNRDGSILIFDWLLGKEVTLNLNEVTIKQHSELAPLQHRDVIGSFNKTLSDYENNANCNRSDLENFKLMFSSYSLNLVRNQYLALAMIHWLELIVELVRDGVIVDTVPKSREQYQLKYAKCNKMQ